MLSYFLYGNRVQLMNALILFVLYIVHIFLMKYSSKYEVAIKAALANKLEVRELSNIAKKDINKFHMNLKSQAISIEMLNKVKFKLRDNYIILEDTVIRKKRKLSNIIKQGEEVFATREDKTLTARRIWKEATQQIIIKI